MSLSFSTPPCFCLSVSVLFLMCFFSLIRAAMTSIQQLRGDLTSSGDQPSTNLATYFKVGLYKYHLLTIYNDTAFLAEFHIFPSAFRPVIRIAPWTLHKTC